MAKLEARLEAGARDLVDLTEENERLRVEKRQIGDMLGGAKEETQKMGLKAA